MEFEIFCPDENCDEMHNYFIENENCGEGETQKVSCKSCSKLILFEIEYTADASNERLA